MRVEDKEECGLHRLMDGWMGTHGRNNFIFSPKTTTEGIKAMMNDGDVCSFTSQ